MERGRGEAVMYLSQQLWPNPQQVPELQWPFRIVLHWAKLFPHYSFMVCMTLIKVAIPSRGSPKWAER